MLIISLFLFQTYKVSPGSIDSGKAYEIKITALVALKCCLEDLDNFWVASNVMQCGNLDDIILFKKERNSQRGVTYLFQLKHEDNPVSISKNEILAPHGKFSLATYSKGYQKLLSAINNNNQNTRKLSITDHLRENSEKIYILFTNRNVAGEFQFLKSIETCPHLINVNGDVYKFRTKVLDTIDSAPFDRKSLCLIYHNLIICLFILNGHH